MADESISPELALVDPNVAREPGHVIDPLEPPRAPDPDGNGAAPPRDELPLETLLYNTGLITAEQLGELVRDSVLLERPVAEVALERGMVEPETLRALLAPQPPPAPTAFIERVDVTSLPPDVVEQLHEATGETWGHHVEPFELKAVPATESAAAYTVMLRFENGERLAVDSAATYDGATELARALAARFADAAEWPFAGGRFIRPETVVSVDLERALED